MEHPCLNTFHSSAACCLALLQLSLVHQKWAVQRVDFHLFDMAGSIGADGVIVDPTAPC